MTRRPFLAAMLLAVSVGWAAPAPVAAQGQGWVAEDEVVYHIFVRSFRDSDGDQVGDLRGIQQGLDYLQRLGITSLLLSPIMPSPFYHNYFASSFEGVDSTLGTEADLVALCRAVHARGMRIYLDQELQYVTTEHEWYQEAVGHPGSRFSGFLPFHGPGNTEPESAVFGISVFPMYNGQRVGLATVNLPDGGVKAYFTRLFSRMLDPDGDGRFDDGLDGFRIDHMMDDLDYKGLLPDLFARFWVPVLGAVRTVNPSMRVIAEQADWGYGEDFLRHAGADMVFAFPIRGAAASLQADALAEAIRGTVERTPAGKGQLLFVENHDTDRFASVVGSDRRKERIGAALTIFLKGTPSIYYGQELGMRGRQNRTWGTDANDIPVREAMEWSRTGEGPGMATWYRGTDPWWTGQYARADDGVSVEEEEVDSTSLLAFYRRALALRRDRPELRHGAETVVAGGPAGVLQVLRSDGTAASLLLINLNPTEATVVLDRAALPGALTRGRLHELLTGRPEAGGSVALPPFGVKLVGR